MVGYDDKSPTDEKGMAISSGRSMDGNDGEGETHMTKAKWLACFALGLSYTTSFQQGACLGSIVKSIDEALGPKEYYNWMISASTITTAISLMLSGGLSDIFGRRYFVILGCFIGIIASIVAIVAKSVPMIIASSVVAGLGAGSQQLALAATSELVPNKHRGKTQAVLDLCILPWSIFGAITGGAMVTYHGKEGFRINFYIGLVLNALCLALIWLWYHPPSVTVRMRGKSKSRAFREIDWSGVFLLNTGLVLLLVGISIGGPGKWTTVPVLLPLIIGIAELVFFFIWERKFAVNPFLAKELFAGQFRKFVMFLVVDFVAGMGLYAAAAFWAQLVRGVWQGDPIEVGILSIPGGSGGALGGFLAGMLIGRGKLFKTNYCLVYGTLIKTIADYCLVLLQPSGPYSKTFGMGIGFLSMFGTGWTSVSLIVCVQLCCDDADIGLATLILGAVRAVGGSVAVTIYSSLINTVMKTKAGPIIGNAVVPLGYPEAALGPLIINLINENVEAARHLPGVTEPILKAAREALKGVWTIGFHQVYLAAASFSAVSVLAALLSQDVSGNMTNHVAVRLENEAKRPDTEHYGAVPNPGGAKKNWRDETYNDPVTPVTPANTTGKRNWRDELYSDEAVHAAPAAQTSTSWRDAVHNEEPDYSQERPRPIPKTTSSWRDAVHQEEPVYQQEKPRPIPKTTSSWRDQVHHDEPSSYQQESRPQPVPKTSSSWRDAVHAEEPHSAPAPQPNTTTNWRNQVY